MLFSDWRCGLEFFGGEGDAGGVVGGAEDRSLLAWGDGGFEAGRRGSGNRGRNRRARGRRPQSLREVLVHDEIGIEEEDLIAGVESGEHGEDQAGGGARG